MCLQAGEDIMNNFLPYLSMCLGVYIRTVKLDKILMCDVNIPQSTLLFWTVFLQNELTA